MHSSSKYKHTTSFQNNRLKSFDITKNDLDLIIKNVSTNKAHVWDDISIRMIQLCGKSTLENVVPIHKKVPKNLIKNYRPVSLLPIFRKIIERL